MGFSATCGMCSANFGPVLVTYSLNLSDINCLSCVLLLSMRNSRLLENFDLLPIISLNIFQAFLSYSCFHLVHLGSDFCVII